MRGQPHLVLVHSPLVGPSTWEPVARTLAARGFGTHVPSLAGVFEQDGPYCPKLAATVADAVPPGHEEGVVVVGHSGAGTLLPAAAQAMKAPVIGTVFVDAVLPHPGRAWFETVPEDMRERLREISEDGLLPPWDQWFPPGTVERLLPGPAVRSRFREELPRVPLSYFGEPAPDCPAPPPARAAYLRLSDAYTAEADRAEREGWRVSRRSTHHLAMLTDPEEVAAGLEELAERLTL